MQSAALDTMASTTARARGLFDRIFVAIDFTSASHRAVAVALEFQRSFGSRLCMFGIAEVTGGDDFIGGLGAPSSPDDLVRALLGRLRRFTENVAPECVELIEFRARVAVKAAEDIHNEARRWNATLLVAATAFKGFIRSPAEKLVHGFDIPVLLIPAVASASEPRISAGPADWKDALPPGISRKRGGF